MNLWDKILLHSERRVNPHSFATWFRPTRLERAEEDRLVMRRPTRLFKKRLTETYGQLHQGGVTELGRPQLQLEYLCAETQPVTASVVPPPQAKLDFDAVAHQLNPRYTFESFIVGASNQFRHAAPMAVPATLSTPTNPL